MEARRKFVTAVILFVSFALATACTSQHRNLTRGNAGLGRMQSLRADLESDFSIHFNPLVIEAGDARGGLGGNARDYDWARLFSAERARVRELLQNYVRSGEEVLEIDTRKGVQLTKRDQVERSLDEARAFLTSLTSFEAIVKPGYEPSAEARRLPAYKRSTAI